MKRKIYATARERKLDQFIGFVAFFVVNAALQSAASELLALAAAVSDGQYYDQVKLALLLAPWIVNGVAIAAALAFRPHIGIGYMAAFGVALCVSVAVGILFLGACFAVCAVMVSSTSSPQSWLLLLFLGLLLLALVFLIGLGIVAAVVWWVLHK